MNDAEWFEAMTHEPVDMYDPDIGRPTLSAAASLATRLVNGFRSNVKPRDWDALRPFFAWKPRNVIRHTFGATTQFAKNVVRLPLRAHFMPRFPALNVRRLQETFATDTFFSATPAHDGTTMCQLFVGRQSKFTDVYPMKAKSEYPRALLDFIRQHGAMQGIFSDNANEQMSAEVKNILRQYNIKDMQSEPYQQNQNPAERRIQEVKAMTTTTMDRTGAPKKLWLFCLIYCVYVLNRLAHVNLNQRTPMEACFGVTPDISALLCFSFYEEVYYFERDQPFPESRERKGRFLGVSENKGDALTFKILTDDENFTVIDRSVVRPVDPDNRNLRADSPSGEISGDEEPILHSLSEEAGKAEAPSAYFDSEKTTLPTVDPLAIIGRTFLLDPNEDGEVFRAEVKEVYDPIDGETGLLKVRVGDADEIMTYNAVMEGINRQLEHEAEKSEEEKVWIFKDILEHRKHNGKYEVKVQWEDDQETWEPLANMANDDPITLARYASNNGLLDTPGWKRFRRYAKNMKKMNRLVRQSKLKSKRTGPVIKFGVRVPRNYTEAVELDRKNGNTLWQDATKTEMSQIYEFGTFKSLGKRSRYPPGFSKIKTWLIFDVKQDGRRKARLVCGGHMTPPSTEAYFSSVASIRAVRLAVFLGELNGLNVYVGDIGNAYLTSKTNEKVVFTAGPEFAPFGHEGHLMQVIGACYGLRDSGSRFHERLSEVLIKEEFYPSKADRDLWMKDCGDHYEYICTWVDDILYVGKDPKAFFDRLVNVHKFKLKGVGEPEYHLGGDFKRTEQPEKFLIWGSKTYIKRMFANYEQMFGEPIPRRKVHAPLAADDHPEIDESGFCDEVDKKHYWSMIGELQWAITLGRFDIMCPVMTMSRFRPQPRIGHLKRLKRIYQYLHTYPDTSIKFNVEYPDYSKYNVIAQPEDWGKIYQPCCEDIPQDAPIPKGKGVMMTTFVDANLLHDLITGRSCTGILHMLNKTPIDWYSKRQSTCETATYGSEMVAARIAVDQIVDLRYSLRMLGVPILGPTTMFGDNLSVVNSATLPSGKLMKRNHILNYHRTREAQACGVCNFVHMNGKDNPADILTKFRSSSDWYPLVKPFLFWRTRD